MTGAPPDDTTRVGARVEVIDLEAPDEQDNHSSAPSRASMPVGVAGRMQPQRSSTRGGDDSVGAAGNSSSLATSRKRAGGQLDFQMMD